MTDSEDANVKNEAGQEFDSSDSVESALSSMEQELQGLTDLVSTEGEDSVPLAESIDDVATEDTLLSEDELEHIISSEAEDAPAVADEIEAAPPIDDLFEEAVEEAIGEAAPIADDSTVDDPIMESAAEEIDAIVDNVQTGIDPTFNTPTVDETTVDGSTFASQESAAVAEVADEVPHEPTVEATDEVEETVEFENSTVEPVVDTTAEEFAASDEDVPTAVPEVAGENVEEVAAPVATAAPVEVAAIEGAVTSETAPAPTPEAEVAAETTPAHSTTEIHSPSADESAVRSARRAAPDRARSRRPRSGRSSHGQVEAAIESMAAFLLDDVNEMWGEARDGLEELMADLEDAKRVKEEVDALHREMRAMRDDLNGARRESRQLHTQIQNLRDDAARARQRADAAALDSQAAADRAVAAAREAELTIRLDRDI